MACEREQDAVRATRTAYENAKKAQEEDPSPANFKNERQKYNAWVEATKILSGCRMANAEPPLTNVAPCLVNVGEWTYQFVVDPDGRVVYNKWVLGGGGTGWQVMPGDFRTDLPVAASAVQSRNYIFVSGKDRASGRLMLNQCEATNPANPETWVGWG